MVRLGRGIPGDGGLCDNESRSGGDKAQRCRDFGGTNRHRTTGRSLKAEHYNAVVLALDGANAAKEREAARAIEAAGFDLYYWIEIGRNPALADAHPEWMASLEVHHAEWRRLFPKFPKTKEGEVVKNYPWVPVLYKETFPVHLERVKKLLADKPTPWLESSSNDLQGPPSSCGCGHHLCRWATDYGPVEKATATRLPKDAAAKFVTEVKKAVA